jgi:hypothetical protein
MQYLMTGIELHPDKGFGITADSYYESAEHLMTNHFKNYDSTQQAEMPQNFLFRHSIELYLILKISNNHFPSQTKNKLWNCSF